MKNNFDKSYHARIFEPYKPIPELTPLGSSIDGKLQSGVEIKIFFIDSLIKENILKKYLINMSSTFSDFSKKELNEFKKKYNKTVGEHLLSFSKVTFSEVQISLLYARIT